MWFNIPPHLFIVHTLPWETLRPWKSQAQQKRTTFLRINKVTSILFVHIFCQSHALTINVQNFVHQHARMLSVAFSTR